jgi:DNA methylase
VKEYVLVYCKSTVSFNGLIGQINSAEETYPCVNATNKRDIRKIPAGIKSNYRTSNYRLGKGSIISADTMDLVLHSDLVIKDSMLAEELIIEGNWRYTQNLMSEYAEKNELYITQDLYLRRIVKEARYKTLKDLLSRVGDDENLSHKAIDINDLFSDGWGSNEDGEEELKNILDKKGSIDFPKPRKLIEKLLISVRNKDAIILDSFAGSGTTAHAVLDLNKEDGGNRKFILVEMEDYADSITAERVRRVIKGVPNAKDEKLKQGLGGSFTFCELGKEISIEKIITGESLPDYGALAQYVFYTATGKSLDGEAKEKLDFYVGETDLYEVYLIYKSDVAFLRGNDSALNDIKLKAIAARNSKKEKLVFATAKYMGQKELSTQNITFCQLPYSIHRVVGA